MCYALGCMLFILCWAGRPASEDRPGAPEAPGLHIGIVHQGAVYATDRSTAVYRGEAFGPELRVCRIGPADPTGQVWESVDFPPRWKVGQGMLVFANADSHDRWGSHYGYHARAFYTYAISLAQIEKRIVDERGTAREKNDDWVAAAKEEEFVDCLLHDRNANLLHAILVPTLLYVNERDKVDSEEHPFSNYEFFYDLLPANVGACDYVVLASGPLQEEIEQLRRESREKREMDRPPLAADYSGQWRTAKEPLKPMLGFWHRDERGQWALVEKIKDPCFNERFHVFPQGTSYYFVTDSGKLYVARKPDKGERKLEEVWVDKKRPIHGAITDTASGKTFLFGAELADSPQFFYFELSDKPEICKCDRPKLIDKRLPRSLDVSISYARILVADKKIKVESKAQPKPDPKP